MKRIMKAMILFVLTVTVASAGGFKKGDLYLGPSIGLGDANINTGLFGMYLGVNVEYALDKHIGIGASVGWISASESESISYGGSTVSAAYEYSTIPIMISGAYHWSFKSLKKLDFFGGLALGYHFGAGQYNHSALSTPVTWEMNGISYRIFSGARYFLSKKLRLNVKLGWGRDAPYLNAGLDFRL